VDRLLSVHEAQVLTYLRLLNAPAGLLINFNVSRLLDGLKRILNSRYVAPEATEGTGGASRETGSQTGKRGNGDERF